MKYMQHSTLAILLAATFATTPVMAEEILAMPEYTFLNSIKEGQSMTSFRLRYEEVEQDPSATFRHDAQAWTLRSLVGWQSAPYHNFSIGAQIINVAKLSDDFNNLARGVPQPGKGDYPAVVDPDFTNINQLYVDWTGIRNTKVRLGRQSVKLDNVRFIGNVDFRQVMQVFDGIAVENKSIQNVELYAAWFNRVRSINTDLKTDDTGILRGTWRYTPSESLTAYAYLADQEEAPAAADFSSQTFGLRLDGSRKLDDNWRLLYTAEYAKQDDYRQGLDNVDAHYYRIGAGAGLGVWWARLDQELLSSNDGKYGFRTPLGTNHLYQGWADKFLTTPNSGIRDTFITAGSKWGNVTFLTEYHWIESDENFAKVGGGQGNSFGKEWDVSVAYTYDKHLSGKVEYASFKEEEQRAGAGPSGRVRDTDKLWLTMMVSF